MELVLDRNQDLFPHLKALGVPLRDSRLGVGKRMGDSLWLHRAYAFLIPAEPLIRATELANIRSDDHPIIRFNKREGSICFLASPDFEEAHEPMVSGSVLVKADGSVSRSQAPADPLIWHHKWTMVDDTFPGFDVREAMERSITWKAVLGNDAALSSRIGRLSFWDNWLAENGLPDRVPNRGFQP